MSSKTIRDLFACDVTRRIEEVIKVDQTDEQVLHDELGEYVMTDSITDHYKEILERYWETPKKPHEGIAVWVSGFFGSGKSSFAKYLGLALENRKVLDSGAAEYFSRRTGDARFQVLLKSIGEHVPTEAVIFDVSTDRGIRTGNQTITEIMYRLFLHHLGYARDLDLSELEITLEAEGKLEAFQRKFHQVFKKDWDTEKGKLAVAVQQASRVMHELDSSTFPTADSWRASAMTRTDISPGHLAQRCIELMGRRRPGKALLFVVDEVGQFVARDVQKILELQAVVQSLGRVGRGKMWLVVTSQEKLNELVSGLDEKRAEFARLMDRFPLQVHLEPADISEVTSKRVLQKKANADKTLRELFAQHRGRLTDNTRLTADIKLPELTTDAFVELYPLLPYQIDLIIQVVSGLRTQGGASKHVGGANRTIIKLAQQLLIHPDVNLGAHPLGKLVTIDQIYDLVSGNIPSELRGKIDGIRSAVEHPMAQPVAKAICLLQYVRSVHRTAENIAAALHPAVDADSRLPEVKAALTALEKAHQVRQGEDGYRIPSPAEDDWERQRSGLSPKPGEAARIHKEILKELWQPQPCHILHEVKTFKAGLVVNDERIEDGDIPVLLTLAEAGKDYADRVKEGRSRSQAETKSIFWITELNDAIDRETVEVFRSQQILTRKERGAQTKDEAALVAEEKLRLNNRHRPELKRLLKQAVLAGSVFFRGNDRSPPQGTTELGRATIKVLSQALPDVFSRFQEAAAQVGKNDLDQLLKTESLRGLPPIFADLKLLRDQAGKTVFNVEAGPLKEVLSLIELRASYGELATGRYVAEAFAAEPYGWDFDVVRLFVVALLRAGKIVASSKGQTIESASSVDAQNVFSNNNLFRQASFQPKVGLEFHHLVEAAECFKDVFGREIPEIQQGVVATTLRDEVQRREGALGEAHTLLVHNRLPGADVLGAALDLVRAIRTGKEDQTILQFKAGHKQLKEAMRRAAELLQVLTPPRLQDLGRAREAVTSCWPVLEREPDLPAAVRESAARLSDLLARETFFRELPAIDEHATVLEKERRRRHQAAVRERVAVYRQGLDTLRATPGWEQLSPEDQQAIASPLSSRASEDGSGSLAIELLRTDAQAASGRLQKAIEDTLRRLVGNRVVSVQAAAYFAGGIETEEQLQAALEGLQLKCLELIAAGKKVLVQ